jgi:N-acetylglucosaminyldiphosphoundecaprenol N-acetyl-beta-D-mannosaminyltransferase
VDVVRDLGKQSVVGVLVDAVDYEAAVERILSAARRREPYAATALAVHGVMTGVRDPYHAYRLNHLDLVTPDGQPVRWALNWVHGAGLNDRVCGPQLMLNLCEAAAREGIAIYLYGSRQALLERLEESLTRRFPGLRIAGSEPSKFRRTTPEEKDEIVRRIRSSGAAITFVGLGCPRQEVFAYEYRGALEMPVVAVGAAFDYHAGFLKQPPALVQRMGLEWLSRLIQEPRRLWRRYVILNPQYLARLAVQRFGGSPDASVPQSPPSGQMLYG